MATNDDILLKLTASKMNIHRSTKLETIATQSIVRNLDSFLDPKYSETRHVMLLPIALRNIVLRQWLMMTLFVEKQHERYLSNDDCDEILEKRMKVFQSLVSCHTLELDLTPFIEDCSNFLAREHLLEYFKPIGAKASNLKVLIILESILTLREKNKRLCNAIGKLQNLTTLNISNTEIDYTNLKKMCKNLKSLTHLSTRINFDQYFDESNEREIEELQIFSNLIVFETDGENEMFTLNCIQHLPKLQCFGYLGFPKLNTSMIGKLLDRCPNQKFALTRMLITVPSNKEIHLNFPDVNDLKVRCDRSDNFITNTLPKFSKIENLSIEDFHSVDRVIPYLDAYGHGLHSLRLYHCSCQLKLSSILDRCPKLQNLFLKYVSILPECSRPDVHSFSTGLKELDWRPRFFEDPEDRTPLLLDILSVPTLECVTLDMICENFHLEDIEKLTAMVTSRQILGNLKRLKIFVYCINHRVFYALSDFIKSASAFLPHLTDLETNILSDVKIEMNSEASSEITTLKKFIDVYQN